MKNKFYLLNIFFALICSLLPSCQNQSRSTLRIAATSVPHGEILEQLQEGLEKEGIHLEILIVEDFHTPNRALNDREVDANFFQHHPFLAIQNREFGYNLEALTAVHVEPMALYSKKMSRLEDLQNGSVIAIPSDPTNQARALCLLEQIKAIELNRHDSEVGLLNISSNPKQFQFIEVDSALLSRSLDDVDLAAITTNFALQAGLSPRECALATERADSDFANLVVIRSGEQKRQDLQILKQAITSEKVRTFIEERYRGAICPSF